MLKRKTTLLLLVAVLAFVAWFAAGSTVAHRLAGWTWDVQQQSAVTLSKPTGWKWSAPPAS